MEMNRSPERAEIVQLYMLKKSQPRQPQTSSQLRTFLEKKLVETASVIIDIIVIILIKNLQIHLHG